MRAGGTLWLIAAIATGACTLDRMGLAPDSASERDAGSRDAARPDAGRRDAGARDGGIDAGQPDAGAPDAGPPDAGARPCAETYAGIDSFRDCVQTDTSCEFYGRFNGTPCGNICSSRGGECIDSFADAADGECGRLGDEVDCMTPHGDAICVCTRP
jgi:hypothetical protein